MQVSTVQKLRSENLQSTANNNKAKSQSIETLVGNITLPSDEQVEKVLYGKSERSVGSTFSIQTMLKCSGKPLRLPKKAHLCVFAPRRNQAIVDFCTLLADHNKSLTKVYATIQANIRRRHGNSRQRDRRHCQETIHDQILSKRKETCHRNQESQGCNLFGHE